MRVLLIFTLNDVQSARRPIRTPEITQLGLSYLSAVLQSAGHETRLAVLSRVFHEAGNRILEETLHSFQPDVVGFHAVSSEFAFVSEVAALTQRLRPQAKLIIGGPHATLDPASTMERFDAACLGEGEYPLLEYVGQLAEGKVPSGIANLWLRQGATIEKNAARPFLKDLDDLPLPDRAMWEPWIDEDLGAKPSVLLGRGCPFQCTYCSHHVLRTVGSGPYVRFRKPEKIVEEIESILQHSPHYGEIYLEQETIGVNAKWSASLFDALADFNARREKPVTFGVNLAVAPNIEYLALFAGMKRANVRYVNIGLESGSERLRREVLHRRYANDNLIEAVKTAKEFGLKVALFNMIGLPTETPEEHEETVRINRLCQPDWNYTSIFYPYPGTDLYKLCEERGLLNGHGPVTIGMERSQAILDLPEFPRKAVQRCYEWFDYKVYRGHRARYRLLAKVVRGKIKARPGLNRFYRWAALSAVGRKMEWILNPARERIHALK